MEFDASMRINTGTAVDGRESERDAQMEALKRENEALKKRVEELEQQSKE